METTKSFRNINELSNWDQNPKSITEKGMARLIDQLKLLGQYKPLLCTPDGTVIGGNSRLRAYRMLKDEADKSGNQEVIDEFTNIWVSVIDFVQDEKSSLWYAIVNGKRRLKAFTHKETGMLEYALSDHDEPGSYNEGELANMVEQYEADTSLYGVHFGEPLVISEITEVDQSPPPSVPPKEIECPACHEKFTPQ